MKDFLEKEAAARAQNPDLPEETYYFSNRDAKVTRSLLTPSILQLGPLDFHKFEHIMLG